MIHYGGNSKLSDLNWDFPKSNIQNHPNSTIYKFNADTFFKIFNLLYILTINVTHSDNNQGQQSKKSIYTVKLFEEIERKNL